MESTISKNPRYRGEHTQLPFQISMAAFIERQSLSKTAFKPTVWKRYINDIFSLWEKSKPDIVDFFKFTERVNLHNTLQWNSRPKYLTLRQYFWTRLYTKAQHSTKNEKKLSLTQRHILNGNLPVYTFSPLITHQLLKWIWQTRSLENPPNKLLWGSISDFKKRLMDRGWPQNFERKIAIRSNTHKRKAALWNKTTRKKKKYCLSWHNTSP